MSSTLRKKPVFNRPDGPQCPHCLKRFADNTRLRNHIDRLHNPNKTNNHACPTCHKLCSELGSLMRHIRTVHNREKRFVCSHCGKRCSHNSNLQQHIRSVHLGWRTAQCFHCSRTFTTDSNLLKHVERVHERLIRRPRHCSKCDYIAPDPALLKIHFLARHTDNRFGCAFGCDKSYSQCVGLGTKHVARITRIHAALDHLQQRRR